MRLLFTFLKTDRFKKYFFNTGWMFTERLVSLSFVFIISVLTARYLGPEQFGILNYASSICILLSPLCTLGLPEILVRELVNQHENMERRLLGSSFAIMTLGSAAAFVLMIISGVFFHPSDFNIMMLIFLIATSYLCDGFLVYQSYYQAHVKMKYAAISTAISLILMGTCQLMFIVLKMPLLWFGAALILQKFLLSAGLVLFYPMTQPAVYKKTADNQTRSDSSQTRWTFDSGTALNLLRDSWPLFLSGLAVIMYMRIDQIFIKWMMDSESVGQYAAAVRLSEAWYFIPMIISNSVFPAILNAKKTDMLLYHRRLGQLYSLMIGVAIMIALPVTLTAPLIIKFLFGPEFIPASSALTILAWAGVFIFLGAANHKQMVCENFTKITLFRTSMGMVTNIILNSLLIPRYGITGAATATLISYAVATFAILSFQLTRAQGILMLKSFAFLCRPFKRKASLFGNSCS